MIIKTKRYPQEIRNTSSHFFTLTVPEQAQGASKLLQLSNSASWQILQCDITLLDCKSSTNNTKSPIFLPNFLFLFFKKRKKKKKAFFFSPCFFFFFKTFFVFLCLLSLSHRDSLNFKEKDST